MISNAESLVMEALWQKEPLTSEEILAQVGPARGWSSTTVKTLLARLVAKGAVKASRDGKRNLYRPALQRADYVAHESESLIERLFDGRVAPFVSHFSERHKLTREDIDDLKRLIEEFDDGE